MNIVQTSKFLSLVLRHKPASIGIRLDGAGWVEVETLLEALRVRGRGIDRAHLDRVVAENDKRRFEFSEDGARIRARQGHSLDVDLGYQAKEPPEFLFHGTADRFIESIRATGLEKQQRHHVHLSSDEGLALSVGSRHGRPAVLRVRAQTLAATGVEFFLTDNGVWLVAAVPPAFIDFPPGGVS